MLINRANIAELTRGLQLLFQGAFEQAASTYSRVAMEVPSTTAEENYAWLGSFPGMREWLGERVVHSVGTSNFILRNKPFELTLGVDRDHIEDDKVGIYRPMVQNMGFEARVHPDSLVWPLLTNGFSSLCYDGQFFFDTDHPMIGADGAMTTWSNSGGGSGTAWYLLDLSRPIKPLIFQKRRDYQFVAMDRVDDEAVFTKKEVRYGVDARVNAGYGLPQMAYGSKQTLDSTNYVAARAAMMSLKGDHGKTLNVRPTALVVPPSLEKAGADIIKAMRGANGADNVMVGTAELIVEPRLA